MRLLVLGLNHKTAPVEVRQRLALDEPAQAALLERLQAAWPGGGFVYLSTCNRVELYAAMAREVQHGQDARDTEALGQILGQACRMEYDTFAEHMYLHQDEAAVHHLLKVTCSLDSLVVGEPQVTSQVKEAYRRACDAGSAHKVIHRLFHCAFATSKEVYATTSIAQRRVSVASVAVDLANQLFAELARASVLVVGAGEMGSLLIRHLLDSGCRDITVVTRTHQRGLKTARRHGIAAAPWEELDERLAAADVVIASAGADSALYDKASFRPVVERRRGKSLLIIDIAVPRNFDPAIAQYEQVYLYSVDDLAAVAQENLEARQEDAAWASRIIEDNVTSFMDWFGVRDIGPLVGQMRTYFHQISQAELSRFFTTQRQMSPLARRQMEAMVTRMVNKLMHEMINSLHEVARRQGPEEAAKLIEAMIDKG